MLIGISGKAGSGKDTVASVIREMHPELQIVRFAGSLKQAATVITNIQNFGNQLVKSQPLPAPLNDMTGRDFLIVLGRKGREIHPDLWVYPVKTWLEHNNGCGIVPDLRYKNEFRMLKEKGAYLIRVERPGIPQIDDPSETELDDMHDEFNLVLHNTGTLTEFRKTIKKAIAHEFSYTGH